MIFGVTMWGEIEAQSTSVAEISCAEDGLTVDYSNTGNVTPDSKSSGNGEEACPSSNFDTAQGAKSCEHPTCLNDMIEVVAISKSPVKSQQIGEPDLSLVERKNILLELYNSKPLVFLERYQAHLKPEHLEAFSHVSSDFRAQYYCKEVQRRAGNPTKKTNVCVRNHRYAALRALQKEGQYFSEEQMRIRDPLLYEQYIGQYLSEDEILQRSQEAMQRGTGGLADLLIDSYQERVLQGRLEEQQQKEECALEEEEDDDEDEGDGLCCNGGEWEPNAQEKAMLREEFLSQMHERFLEGQDKDFNYSEVDDNPDYDNLDIVSRDAEERYFDEDDDEEEENETDMIQQ